MVRKHTFLTVFLMCFAAPAIAQIIIPPSVVWIGPEDECDHPSIQAWIDDADSCGPFCPPPPGGVQLRLSDNYQHSGNFEINRSVGIIGGFPACGEPSVLGNRKQLQSTTSGALIVLKGPDNNPIHVTLGGLNLVGSSQQSDIGGVLELQGGVELEVQNTRVAFGRAQRGGGIGMHGENNRLTITFDSSIFSNRASEGGGIWCQAEFDETPGVVDFQDGSIVTNSAATSGGGIALDDCILTGSALNKTRRIVNNQVTRDADPGNPNEAGRGGGVYVRGRNAGVELGGILTRTRIENNRVERTAGDVLAFSMSGGGLFADEQARVILRNVEFIDNEAPVGGGLSARLGASVDIDRTSGPCLAGRASECSAFIGNKATNVSGTEFCADGSGSAIHVSTPTFIVRRTTFRDNEASNPDCSTAAEFGGGTIDSPGGTSGQDWIVEQNLFFLNANEHSDTGWHLGLGHAREGDIRFSLNTVAFNSSAGSLLNFNTSASGEGKFEVVGNILFEPDVEQMSFLGRTANLSACNVLSEPLPAEVERANTEDNPRFVDFSTADFHLAPDSAAINRCDDQINRLSPGFDIEGRARPGPDGSGPVLGNYDSGAFEYHENPPDEVDLALSSLAETGDPDVAGSVFEAKVRNVGLTTAQIVKVRFDKPPGGYEETGGNWSCANGSTEAVCTAALPSGLPTALSAPPLIIEMNPDPADGTCVMNMRTDPNNQPDTVSTNNALSVSVPDCDVNGEVPDEIFDDRFEQ